MTKRKGKITNTYYKAFLDGYLLEQITRNDIITVLNNIQHQYLNQARCLLIIAWSTGSRPNEYLRLTPEHFNKTKPFLEIKMPGSKGSESRIISLPYTLENGTTDPLTKEVHEYVRSLFPTQYLFWFFRSNAKRHGVTKKYKKKNGETVTKNYTKIYDELGAKLRYYFPKWFEIIFPEGVPPYYLRHNRTTTLMETAGREATMMNQGWKSEITLKRYTHKTKKMRQQIGEGLMQ